MGMNNKQRRAAKTKAKARARSGGAGRSAGGDRWSPGAGGPRRTSAEPPLFTPAELARNLLILGGEARRRGDQPLGEVTPGLLATPWSIVVEEAERLALELVASIWSGGWQPAELHRQGRIGCTTAVAARLVAWAIAADHADRRATTLEPRWRLQVDELALPPVRGRTGWLGSWVDEEGIGREAAVDALLDALGNLMTLPRLDPILAPPGTAGATARPADTGAGASVPAGAEHDPVLVRIRALLAKAESTTFEAEAVAFTAKAQELMTRHAVDAAIVFAEGGTTDEEPIAIRLPIDAPYIDAKSLLLQVVAQATRCRTVFHGRLAMSTVMGFRNDVAAVEVLFTSLLLQAQTAMAESAKRAPAGSRTRSSSYRSAFLSGYTTRIDERLEEINEAVLTEVEEERGGAFLPVLRSRASAVDDLVAERFGDVVSKEVRGGYDRAGRSHGMLAANLAELAGGEVEAASR